MGRYSHGVLLHLLPVWLMVCQIGGPVWVWRVLLYMRQKANAPMDLELLLFAGITAADTVSFTLVLVLFLVSLTCYPPAAGAWQCRKGGLAAKAQ